MNDQLLKDLYLENRPLAFDLDNTIYREFDFLSLAYKNITSQLYGNDWEVPYEFIINQFIDNGRKDIFNKMLQRFPLGTNKDYIKECINILRNSKFKKKIKTYSWFEDFLSFAKKPYHLRIITNGNQEQQRNKLFSLNINSSGIDLEVIFANDYGGKPNVEAFNALKKSHSLDNLVYVGDSEIDFEFCQNSNIDFLQFHMSASCFASSLNEYSNTY